MTMAEACPEPVDGVVVIGHNLDVIKTADHILDLGPEGGVRGGEVAAQGTPEQVAEEPRSFTGAYLKPMLARAQVASAVAQKETRTEAAE